MNRRIVLALIATTISLPSFVFAQEKELSTTQTIHIKAPPEAVWAYAGDFGGISRWFTAAQASRLVLKTKSEEGAIRELLRANGTRVREKLVEYDASSMRFTYTYADGQVLAKDYFATMELKDAGNGETDVIWTGRFKRLDDAPAEQDEAALVNLYTGIYKRGLDALKAKVEGDQ